ncbi:hypothetical protein TBLA_0B03950 [Henningerozyma blattae CBS 6284]|uniref:Proteasome assembly chaperone 3 n=1 Tax=Henningerozyma blattae (strain ATCC 34711 / CBS 6284 / DSM 70876 / NBRC 10599 / NRRL Y-10934 / UCD 77-7) TaxID=1071380 RepID=I2GYN1_HENB6|nr:hypothetical protein TBLA_0B03950 [Tetrapisispora blattae CBS 6284]CCH59233.1 hypothetical protein TBLA_0B03950 [Tetrapisispora blattae CBS 6284]
MYTKTIKTSIVSPLNDSQSIEIILTIPEAIDQQSKKIPVSMVLYHNDNYRPETTGIDQDKVKLISYHYAVPYTKNNGRTEVVSTPLLDTNVDLYRDLTRQISTLLVKKLNIPVYVAYGELIGAPVSQSAIPMDQLFILRKCIAFVEEQLKKQATH